MSCEYCCDHEEAIFEDEETIVYITGQELRNHKQVFTGAPNGNTESIKIDYQIKFCPMCGDPLTEPRELDPEEAETKLLEKTQNENAYIVTRSMNSAGRLQRKAISLGLDIHFPLSYHEFMRGEYCGRGIKKFILEEVEHFVQFLSPRVEIEIYHHKPKED